MCDGGSRPSRGTRCHRSPVARRRCHTPRAAKPSIATGITGTRCRAPSPHPPNQSLRVEIASHRSPIATPANQNTAGARRRSAAQPHSPSSSAGEYSKKLRPGAITCAASPSHGATNSL
jgi:hypothetical protein